MNIKRIIILLAVLACGMTAEAQLNQVVVETHTLTDPASAQPAGTTTYRIYAEMQDAIDIVTAVFAINNCHSLNVSTTTTFFNDAVGGINPSGVNPAFYAFFPNLEADSFITIGVSDSTGPGAGDVNQAATNPADPFNPSVGFPGGGNLVMEDGAWFTLPTSASALPSGPNNRVLLGQFTTDGDLSFSLNVQVFDDGVQPSGRIDYVASDACSGGGMPTGFEVLAPSLTYPNISDDGCTDVTACNYDPAATVDDGSCEYESCVGCTDPSACNYDPSATISVQSETYTETFDTMFAPDLFMNQNVPANDYFTSPYVSLTSGDWAVLDISSFSCAALTLPNALVWNESITTLFSTLTFSEPAHDVSFWLAGNANLSIVVNHQGGSSSYTFNGNGDAGNYIALTETGISSLDFDIDVAGCLDELTYTVGVDVCEYESCAGCTDVAACNYDSEATIDDGSCDFSCYGCTDATACNYDMGATIDDGSCDFSCYGCTDATACNYDMGATVDDGSCDFSCYGCTDATACNYDSAATVDDGSCEYGSCIGCTDPSACNYDSGATIDDGSCDFSCLGCTDATACNYDMGATVDDGSCDFSCYGCTDSTACNYDMDATVDDGNCDFSCYGCTDATACNYDMDATIDDDSCDFSCYGCTDATACNYDMDATIDDDSCDFSCYGCTDAFACNYDMDATIDDGLCDFSCYGCTDATACNYDMDATIDAGNCDFSCYGCTDATACNYDMDATLDDGSCDFSCYGCTDATACNYDMDATIDDGSCDFSCYGCTDATACNYDMDATIDDGSCDFSCYGCTDATACNYDMDATIDDGSCEYLETYAIDGEINPGVGGTYTYTYQGLTGSTYEWVVTGGDIISGQGTDTIEVVWVTEGAGSISVIETSEGGCVGDNVIVQIDVVTSVTEITFDPINVYPNPTRGLLTIESSEAWVTATIIITDAFGKRVQELRLDRAVMTIDLSEFAAGLYVITLVGNNHSDSVRVLVQ